MRIDAQCPHCKQEGKVAVDNAVVHDAVRVVGHSVKIIVNCLKCGERFSVIAVLDMQVTHTRKQKRSYYGASERKDLPRSIVE